MTKGKSNSVRLFIFYYKVRSGEFEQQMERVIKAPSQKDAEKQARLYLRDYYGKGSFAGQDGDWFMYLGGQVATKYQGVEPITADELAERLTIRP